MIEAPVSSEDNLFSFDLDDYVSNLTQDELYRCFFVDEYVRTQDGEGDGLHASEKEAHMDSPSLLKKNERSIKEDKKDIKLLPIKMEKDTNTGPIKHTRAPKLAKIKSPPLSSSVTCKKEIDDKYRVRLIANKKSAQASRERRKLLKAKLEDQLQSLNAEKFSLNSQITELQTENEVLKRELIQWAKLVDNSAVLSNMFTTANHKVLNSVINRVQSSSTNKNTSKDNASNSGNNGQLPTKITASLYMMIVLWSYGQYFNTKSLPNFSMDSSINKLAEAIQVM